jgi:hypothetical protein
MIIKSITKSHQNVPVTSKNLVPHGDFDAKLRFGTNPTLQIQLVFDGLNVPFKQLKMQLEFEGFGINPFKQFTIVPKIITNCETFFPCGFHLGLIIQVFVIQTLQDHY